MTECSWFSFSCTSLSFSFMSCNVIAEAGSLRVASVAMARVTMVARQTILHVFVSLVLVAVVVTAIACWCWPSCCVLCIQKLCRLCLKLSCFCFPIVMNVAN